MKEHSKCTVLFSYLAFSSWTLIHCLLAISGLAAAWWTSRSSSKVGRAYSWHFTQSFGYWDHYLHFYLLDQFDNFFHLSLLNSNHRMNHFSDTTFYFWNSLKTLQGACCVVFFLMAQIHRIFSPTRYCQHLRLKDSHSSISYPICSNLYRYSYHEGTLWNV